MKLVSLILVSLSAYGAVLTSGGAGSNGIWVNYESRLEPGSPPIQKYGGGVLTEKNTIKRHVCNFDNNTYFGYDLTMEPLREGVYLLRFAPLTITPQKMSEIFEKVSNWTPLPLPGGPVTMEVRAGQTVALDLFVNASTGQKVTDTLWSKAEHVRRYALPDLPATSPPKTRQSRSAPPNSRSTENRSRSRRAGFQDMRFGWTCHGMVDLCSRLRRVRTWECKKRAKFEGPQ